MELYGLIGKHLNHSFSQHYFHQKFDELKLPYRYINIELNTIEDLPNVLAHLKELQGFNVTFPYKTDILPYLDWISEDAQTIGAVNTVLLKKGQLMGYNTDCFGFRQSLENHCDTSTIDKALILGTGGASKAVAYALQQMDIEVDFVSRSNAFALKYEDLNEQLGNYQLVVNCTPLGTFPNVTQKPNIPYQELKSHHILFDLVYNPSTTTFMKMGMEKSCQTANGYQMLELQAEKAWEIWQKAKETTWISPSN